MVELIPLFFIVMYFMPFFIAATRAHHSAGLILVINLLAGWTIFGWIACFTWAVCAPAQTAKSKARDGRKYARVANTGRAPMPRILHNFID
ncbi:MAG: threonine/homoserine/homoserine lactone efflux protein [Myxococcota bacterium]|jgi:threonine/homoserine/homoserine lactone efflux protein